MNLKKIQFFDFFAIGFSTLWIVIVFLDYVNKHNVYLDSFSKFQFPKLAIFLVGFGLLFASFFSGKVSLFQKQKKWLSTPFIVATFYLLILASSLAYSAYFPGPLDSSNHFTLLVNGTFVSLAGLTILFSAYSIGNLIHNKLLPDGTNHEGKWIIDLAIGITAFTLILFIFAMIGILYSWILVPLMGISLGINFKNNIAFLRKLKQDIPMSFIHALIVYSIILFGVFNFIVVLSPFPLGFDSRNLYINLSNLIADNHGFVGGFQPHNWELFAATGKILFKNTEFSMFLSYMGGVLSAWAIYYLSKISFKLSSRNSALIVLLFLVTPSVSHQMFAELKVDLALLYFQLVTLFVFIQYQKRQKLSSQSERNILIILGLLLGFGLGIKLLQLFLIYGVLCALSVRTKSLPALFSLIFLGLGMVLLLQLDKQANLRGLHKYANPITYILLLSGIGCTGYYFKKDSVSAIRLYKKATIVLSVSFLVFLPWLIKNYSEMDDNDSYMKIIQGAGTGHGLDQEKLNEIYQGIINQR